jgi:cytochrome P450
MNTAIQQIRRPPGPSAPTSIDIDDSTPLFLEALQREFGNFSCITTPQGRHAYFVNDPDAIQKILVRDRDRYVKGRGFERVKLLLGNGIFVSDGEHWRRARTMVQPAFTRRHLSKLIGLIIRCSEGRARQWGEKAEAGGTVDITTEMTDFALELILRAIFGADYDDMIVAGGKNPFAFLSDEFARDLQFVLKFRALRELILGVISERRCKGDQGQHDFLSMYVSARDKSGKPFSDRDLLDELMTLIVAGFETSAGTLNWAWHLIAQNEHVYRKIVNEARAVLPVASATSRESVANLTYLEQVLNETMRLYPPGWIFSRRATENLTLADYDVPEGTDVYISPYILHRTEAFWPDAQRFDPGRFAADRLSAESQAAFIPFSLGPRRCIGEHFAMLEMKIHLALMLQRFRPHPTTDEVPVLHFAINLRSQGSIHLRLEKCNAT